MVQCSTVCARFPCVSKENVRVRDRDNVSRYTEKEIRYHLDIDDNDNEDRAQSLNHGGARIAAYTEYTQTSPHQPSHGHNAALPTLPTHKISAFVSHPGT